MSDELELGRKAIKFISMWKPEYWAEKDSPGYVDARAVRLEIDRHKRAKRKARTK